MWYMNEERELIRDTAKEFAEKEVKPFVKEMHNDVYPAALNKRMGELGFTGLPYDESFGGAGKDWTTYGIVIEEISKVSGTMALANLLESVIASTPLVIAGTQEQRIKYLKPVFEGKELISISNTEAAGVVNCAEFQTKAVLDGDEWVINGGKIFTSGTEGSNNFVVAALTSEYNVETEFGMSLFMLPRNTPGFKMGRPENKIGWRGSSSCSMYYDNVRVPKENLVGEIGMASSYLAQMTGMECLTFGPMCLGGAEGVFEKTLKYTRERVQRGVSLYERYQVVRHELAKMFMEIESLRGLVYTSLAMIDAGKISVPHMLQLKVKGAAVMEYVASRAIELHGGNGVVIDNEVECYLRDAKVHSIGGGSSGMLTDLIGLML